WYFGMYAQDTWKTTSKLTLNYGLRWEPYFPPEWRSGEILTFDYERFKQGIKSKVYPNSPAGFYYPGDPGFREKVGTPRIWARFAPRFGVAWDPAGDGRTSIRAGYGYAYDIPLAEYGINTAGSPWGGQTTVPTPAGGLDDPWQGVPGGNRH